MPKRFSTEERLDRLELQLRLIQQHLGLRLRLPPSAPSADSTLPEQSTDYDRIARLERESRHFVTRLEQVQRQLDGLTPPSRVTPVVTHGRLVVQNVTGVPHYLSVNKVQHYVLPVQAGTGLTRMEFWTCEMVCDEVRRETLGHYFAGASSETGENSSPPKLNGAASNRTRNARAPSVRRTVLAGSGW